MASNEQQICEGAKEVAVAQQLEHSETVPRYTVTKDQLMAAATRRDTSSVRKSEQNQEAATRDDAAADQPLKLQRRRSFRKSLGRAGNKVSSAVLSAVRSGSTEAPLNSIDRAMAEWRLTVLEREKQELAMEGAFDAFQDAIEKAMNVKYQELRGEGWFLVDMDSLPEQWKKGEENDEEPKRPNEEERLWLKQAQWEEKVMEFRDPSTGSAQRACLDTDSTQISKEYLVCRTPKPRTYSAPVRCAGATKAGSKSVRSGAEAPGEEMGQTSRASSKGRQDSFQ